MKVLIADDDNVSQMMLQAHLKKLGHNVIMAKDGREAWLLYTTTKPHLVVTDWMMPNIDGLELCRMIRADQRTQYTYVIFLTVMNGKGSFLEAMNAGADDFISKPFDGDQLTARFRVAERILGLQKEIKQLEGLLPICSYCRRIRDDENSWHSIEDYVSQKTEAMFSHGICPSCYEEHVKPKMRQHS